jgi:DNA invertase Pin-like site-specific DNA recombinase
MTSAAGRMMAGILGEFDRAESEIKGERVARAALQRAHEGKANGAVLYGWIGEKASKRPYRTGSVPTRIVGARSLADAVRRRP